MTTFFKPDGRLFLGDAKAGLCAELTIGEGESLRRVTVTDILVGEAATECMKEQMEKPVCLDSLSPFIWAYRGLVFEIKGPSRVAYSLEQLMLIIRHSALKEERKWQRMAAVVAATEKSNSKPAREHLPDAVKQYVWRRDQGRCVKCGSSEKLEYDHIIPIALGGSNTDRNLQLLCEPCNRSKSASI